MGSIRRSKTKRRTRDLDLIHKDLRSKRHLTLQKTQKPAEDLPGLGRFYCVECAKWFEGEPSLVSHRKGKSHKRRIRMLNETPYTQKEAEAAGGLGAAQLEKVNTMLDETPADEAATIDHAEQV